jgi:4-amino-4-deoxy-L-arabinose transferase-like glycosyltransferase
LWSRPWQLVTQAAIAAAIFACYLKVAQNPPGYYIDEASISYNAHLISQTGRDETGTRWPLYFRAFGDYKNPVYIYLLAGLYSLTGPGVLAARSLSATFGIVAALALGLLGWRLTRRREVAWCVTLLTLLTPWLFEMSRMVLEVSLYPLVLALFLLSAHRASTRPRWSPWQIICLAITLALATYTYSIGRLLGPLLALALVLLASRTRLPGLLTAWALYFLSLVPLFLFNQSQPGALSARFYSITYFDQQTPYWRLAWKFVTHYVGNLNPWKLFVTGDPNREQITHLYGTPLLPLGGGILIGLGLWLIFRRHRQDAWWRFILFCLAVSLLPASLTKETVHMLRLAPLLVFLFVLTIPALDFLLAERRRSSHQVLGALALLLFLQAAIFQWQFYSRAHSARRLRQFDNGYPEQIFARALAQPTRPIYLADAPWIPGYIQAYWNAALRQLPISTFARLAPDESVPENGVAISTEENCLRCLVLADWEYYTVYQAKGAPPQREPLPKEAFRAKIALLSAPDVLHTEQKATFRFRVTNASSMVWRGRDRGGNHYQVMLGNHWLDPAGKVIVNDDGRAALLRDIEPGGETDLTLVVNAPRTAGAYILEIDMLQETVSWFGPHGSPTLQLPVRVE